MRWVAKLSFSIYRRIISALVARAFKTQKVFPLEPPDSEHIELVPYETESPAVRIPRLYVPANFPRADRAPPRLRQIKSRRMVTGALAHLKLGRMPPAPADYDALMEEIYPRALRRAWPYPPAIPPQLEATTDRLGSLAVAGPFADYVHRIRSEEIERIDATEAGHVDESAYTIDLEVFSRHAVKPGLRPIGCTVIFVRDPERNELVTRSVLYRNELHRPGSTSWPMAEKVALCSLSTHVTIIKHIVYIHLVYITVHAASAINMLGAQHPIRRLLHHCFHTALIGNHEVDQFQIRGPGCFCAKLFSFDYSTMIDVINEYCDLFDVGAFDPDVDARARGVADAEFHYPFRANVEPLWKIVRLYVSDYVDHYFPADASVAADEELHRWYRELDQRFPGGLGGYAPVLDREAVKKICASLIYTSTVTHDNVNNIVWNYTTLSQYIPTIVSENGDEPPVDIAFDFLTTLIGTFKPYNMLLEGISSVALDEEGRRIMDSFIATLARLQDEMDAQPPSLHGIYPKNLNYSVSN
jgi:hypothetical protein